MKLNDLYRLVLKAAGLVATDDGYVSVKYNDNVKPFSVNEKRVVLPIKEQLQNPDWTTRVVFHPLQENLLRGETDEVATFRGAMNTRFNYTIGLVCYNLLVIAASTKMHSSLSPDQSEFLSHVKNADEKTLEVFQKLLKAMNVSQSKQSMVSIYLKRGGTIDGKRYNRVGIVSFPFYEELVNAQKNKLDEVYGVKLRVKDRDTFVSLMEFIFPGIDKQDSYNRGNDSEIAPFFEVLMKVAVSIASPINDLLNLFADVIEDANELLIEDGWVEVFDNLSVMKGEIRSVPMQTTSEGVKPVYREEEQPQPATKAPVREAAPAYAERSSVQPNNGAPKTSTGKLDFAALCATDPRLGGHQQYQAPPPQYGNGLGNGWDQGQFVGNQPRFQDPNNRTGSMMYDRGGYRSGYNSGGFGRGRI